MCSGMAKEKNSGVSFLCEGYAAVFIRLSGSVLIWFRSYLVPFFSLYSVTVFQMRSEGMSRSLMELS